MIHISVSKGIVNGIRSTFLDILPLPEITEFLKREIKPLRTQDGRHADRPRQFGFLQEVDTLGAEGIFFQLRVLTILKRSSVLQP